MSLESHIYVKKSIGLNEAAVDIYKFRTMVPGSDSLDVQLEFDSFGNPINDPRVTTFFGAFLRKYWVDGLPQLYNLWRGDIKLVGIRPMTPREWERYPEDIKKRALRQKPGLMGIQYAGRRTENFEDHLTYLRKYLDEAETNVMATDLRYLLRILFNITFRGIRSS